MAVKLPLVVDPVVCWKFLYIIHKLCREGDKEYPPNFCIASELNQHNELIVIVHDSELPGSDDDSTSNRNHTSPTLKPICSENLALNSNSPHTEDDHKTDIVQLDQVVPLNRTLVSHEPLRSHEDQMNNNHPLCSTSHVGSDEKHEFLMEAELLKSEIERLKSEHRELTDCLLDRVHTLEEELKATVQFKVTQEEHTDALELKVRTAEQQCEMTNEKFNKLKEIYCKLREEHVGLLREAALTNEQLSEQQKADDSETMHYRTKLAAVEKDNNRLKEDHVNTVEALRCAEALMAEFKANTASLEARCDLLEKQCEDSRIQAISTSRDDMLVSACRHAVNRLQQVLASLEDEELFLELKSSPEMLRTSAENTEKWLSRLECSLGEKDTNSLELPLLVSELASSLCEALVHNRSIAAGICDLTSVQAPHKLGLELGEDAIHLLQNLEAERGQLGVTHLDKTQTKLAMLITFASEMCRFRQGKEKADEAHIEETIAKEMLQTSNVVKAAEEKFRQMSANATTQLPITHQLILDHCSSLMAAIADMITKSKEIQSSLDATAAPTETYKRHSRWTQGLVSAAKSVGACANVLVEIADNTLSDHGEDGLERLLAIAHEVSASTAQLYAASCIKVTDQSEQLTGLKNSRNDVSKATGQLVGSVKSAIETRESTELDFSHLTLTQAKRMEVESQVRALKLENELEKERRRLGQLRRENYQESAEVEVMQNVA